QRITEPDAVVWQDGSWWLGHLRQHPDYWTQGKDLEDLREHLRDLQADITSGSVPGVGARGDE
ncbi:MAG TPA: hypothetical protein VFJ82_07380, partial [Longimicrobium sp.]|nr:hypothetical protein [Longimicrobium sp.]